MFDNPLLLIIIGVFSVVIAFLASLLVLRNFYIKVSPNRVAVISGSPRRLADGSVVGYRFVSGGSTLVRPFLEKVDYLDLSTTVFPLLIERALTIEDVPISVKARATVKIKKDDISIRSAAERFLGKTEAEFHQIISQIVQGDLLKVISVLTEEEAINNSHKITQELSMITDTKLEEMGIELIALTIQEVHKDVN